GTQQPGGPRALPDSPTRAGAPAVQIARAPPAVPRALRPHQRPVGVQMSSAIWSRCVAPYLGDARLPPAPRGVRSRRRQRSCRARGREPRAAPATRRPDASHSQAAAATPVRQGLLGADPAGLAALGPTPGHCPARDGHPLASAGVATLLALEVPPAARPAAAE